ncbi:MAG: TetR/AcrR family transcriptional regulator [Lachnospiraceae bacterium]
MEKKIDLRVVKTYTALTNAFMDLIKKKKIEDITVNELCERAIIRRTTFYKHFADKYEFISFIIRRFQQENMEVLDILKPNEPQEFYEVVVNKIFEETEKNEQLVFSLLESTMAPILSDIFAEQLAAIFEENFQEIKKIGVPLPVDPGFLAQLFTGAMMQSLKWWVNHKDRLSKDKMKQQLLQLILMINEMIGSGYESHRLGKEYTARI